MRAIYCNNNFDGNQTDFALKIAMPPKAGNALSSQMASQTKPKMMALNIPTHINLYGYGYHNVYELNELVNVNDPRGSFEGSIVEKKYSPIDQIFDLLSLGIGSYKYRDRKQILFQMTPQRVSVVFAIKKTTKSSETLYQHQPNLA